MREISGFAPYEMRVHELLKNDKAKRALKFCKKRVRECAVLLSPPSVLCPLLGAAHTCVFAQLGTHVRAKRKREEMTDLIQKMRQRA